MKEKAHQWCAFSLIIHLDSTYESTHQCDFRIGQIRLFQKINSGVLYKVNRCPNSLRISPLALSKPC